MEAKFIVFFILFNIQTIRTATINDTPKELGDRLLDRKNYDRRNFEKISRSPEFLVLDYPEILELIKSDIVVTYETIVFDSVKKWINHDSASRKRYMDELSNFIKFEYLSKNILLSESHDFCSENSSPQCHAKILNALQQKEKNNFESADDSFRDSYSTIMAVGSFSPSQAKTLEVFDLRNEKWIKIEKLDCNRTQFSAVLLDDKVMLIGGINDDNDAIVNTVQSYDLNTGAMENLPPMKYARKELSAVEFKGRVYAFGGFDGENYLSYVEMWDPVLQIWKELTRMPNPSYRSGAAILDEEIVIVGGENENGQLSKVESYNPVTDKWTERASMNDGRSEHGVAVAGGYLYAVTGMSNTFRLETAEKYNPVTDKWTFIHSLNETRFAAEAANLFGKLVIIGGLESLFDERSAMDMYDDDNDKWISMPPLTEERYYFNTVQIPWRLAKATLSRDVSK